MSENKTYEDVMKTLKDVPGVKEALVDPDFLAWKAAGSGQVNVKVKRLSPDATLPYKAHEQDAGFDLCAIEDKVIDPGETAKIKTGIAVELPPGFELQVRPRSGISLKTKLRVANSPGTVDASFRGEVGVIVDNTSDWLRDYADGICETTDGMLYVFDDDAFIEKRENDPLADGKYIIRKGDKIAQGVVMPVPAATFTEVDELDATERGAGGFGHTGTNAKEDE